MLPRALWISCACAICGCTNTKFVDDYRTVCLGGIDCAGVDGAWVGRASNDSSGHYLLIKRQPDGSTHVRLLIVQPWAFQCGELHEYRVAFDGKTLEGRSPTSAFRASLGRDTRELLMEWRPTGGEVRDVRFEPTDNADDLDDDWNHAVRNKLHYPVTTAVFFPILGLLVADSVYHDLIGDGDRSF